MKSNDLKTIFHIQEILKKNKYPDIQRISREINDFSVKNNISLEEILKRVENNEPWEYIRGTVEFHGNVLNIKKGVLIPRLETEGLVDLGIEEIKKYSPSLVLDIGTGSGAIILSLAKHFKDGNIDFIGTDISSEALSIAEMNKKSLNINNCRFLKSDLLKDLNNEIADKRYCIVSNPPYVPTKEYLKLDKSVKDFEPRIAIDGGDTGLSVYEEMFKQVIDVCTKPLFMILECHSTMVNETADLALKYFPLSKQSIKKDCFDKDRFLEIFL